MPNACRGQQPLQERIETRQADRVGPGAAKMAALQYDAADAEPFGADACCGNAAKMAALQYFTLCEQAK